MRALNFIYLLVYLVVLGCGFKVLDQSKFSNFAIQNIDTLGEKRINYKIKNNIINNSLENSENLLQVLLNTGKLKSIKEKNINNEITKYEIIITSKVTINFIDDNKDIKFTEKVFGDYIVGNNYSTTISNEKKLINNLAEDLSKKILNKINAKLNDL